MGSQNKITTEENKVSTLVHPLREPDGSSLDQLPTTFIEQNKLGAAVAAKIPGFEDSTPEAVTEENVYTELNTLIQTFEANDVEYAVIKSLLPVPKQIGDIDILVTDLDAVGSQLVSMGYTLESRQPYKRKYCRVSNQGRVVVHLHEEIAWHGQIYVDKNKLLRNTVEATYPKGQAAVPSPTHEALIIAAHMLFEKANNRILLLDALSYRVWYENDELDLDEMRTMADEYGWLYGLQCFLSGIADVYRQTYDEPFAADGVLSSMGDCRIPYQRLYATFLISFGQMYTIRKHRIRWMMQNKTSWETLHCLQTYIRDFITEATNRYGFTYTMKRVFQ